MQERWVWHAMMAAYSGQLLAEWWQKCWQVRQCWCLFVGNMHEYISLHPISFCTLFGHFLGVVETLKSWFNRPDYSFNLQITRNAFLKSLYALYYLSIWQILTDIFELSVTDSHCTRPYYIHDSSLYLAQVDLVVYFNLVQVGPLQSNWAQVSEAVNDFKRNVESRRLINYCNTASMLKCLEMTEILNEVL